MSIDPRLQLTRELARVTEKQLHAARTLDGATLQKLNEARTEAVFELRVAMQDRTPMSAELREAVAAEAKKIQLLDRRLRSVSNSVVAMVDRMIPGQSRHASRAPATYRPSGRMRR